MKYNPDYRVKGFIDKDKELHGRFISGKKVDSLFNLGKIIEKKKNQRDSYSNSFTFKKAKVRITKKFKQIPSNYQVNT